MLILPGAPRFHSCGVLGSARLDDGDEVYDFWQGEGVDRLVVRLRRIGQTMVHRLDDICR